MFAIVGKDNKRVEFGFIREEEGLIYKVNTLPLAGELPKELYSGESIYEAWKEVLYYAGEDLTLPAQFEEYL